MLVCGMGVNIKKDLDENLNEPVDNDSLEQDLEELSAEDNSSVIPLSERGSAEVSGTNPDPESDDDVLQNAHNMGIAPNATLEHPTSLNIAKDIADAEKYHKSH